MKSQIASVLLLLVTSWPNAGCNKCSDVSPEPTPPIRLVITDATGKNLVVDGASRFHPDSVRLLDAYGKTDVIFHRELDTTLGGYLFQGDCFKHDSGSSLLLLYLNKTDTDTLLVSYQAKKSRCFTTFEYTRFEYNGVRVYPGGSQFAISIIK